MAKKSKKSKKKSGGKKKLHGAALKAHLAAKKRGGPKPRSKHIPKRILQDRLIRLQKILVNR